MPSVLAGDLPNQQAPTAESSYLHYADKRTVLPLTERGVMRLSNGDKAHQRTLSKSSLTTGTDPSIHSLRDGWGKENPLSETQAPARLNGNDFSVKHSHVAEHIGRRTPSLVNGMTELNAVDGYFTSEHRGDAGTTSTLASWHSGNIGSRDGAAESAAPSANGDVPSAVNDEPNHEALTTAAPVPPRPPSQDYPRERISTHRLSSPPIFTHPAVTTPSPSSSGSSHAPPNKLIHRHTLEVPKISTSSRLSKEYSPSSVRRSDDVSSANGQFSPTISSRRRGSMTLARRQTRSINSDLQLDEVPQDEDVARWADHIRQKRASKRKRQEDDDDDRVVVGTKVDQNHVNWVTAYNMLTGIRFTVSRTNAKIDRELTDADFTTRHKFSFDITGNELTPSAKYDFKFKDYAPWVFRHLRGIFRIDPADYLVSLTSKYILSELGSPGKSGSFFYFSRDYKYIIKTIRQYEHKFLRKILREYYDHVRNNPNTLLSQFYGLHRVKIPYGRKIHFVVMNNLFPPHRDIHRAFDLKGSTIGRDFKEEDLEKNPRATLKDLNWIRRNLHLEFGPTKKHAFIEQMKQDVKLLQRLKIMDYSLLVGIHDLQRGNEDNLRDKTLQVFQPGGEAADDLTNPTNPPNPGSLARTSSKLEAARKAKELRQLIKSQKPIPMDQSIDGLPEDILKERKMFHFYADDGGFRATHQDDRPGDEIYYLGIIDCLTRYGLVKKAEHFLKGMTNPESQISPIPPDRYGDRFMRFICGITKTREEAEKEKERDTVQAQLRKSGEEILDDPKLTGVNLRTNRTAQAIKNAEEQAEKGGKNDVPDRSMGTVKLSGEGRDTGASMTLPVVEEAVESGSTGGRSGNASPAVPEPEEQQNPPPQDMTTHNALAHPGIPVFGTTKSHLGEEEVDPTSNAASILSPPTSVSSGKEEHANHDPKRWRGRETVEPPRLVQAQRLMASPIRMGEVEKEVMEKRLDHLVHHKN